MKKSFLFLTLFAAFAMIFASCSKKDSSSSNNGGDPTPTSYGTVTVGNQSFAIVAGGWTIGHDDDNDFDFVGIALVDRVDSSENRQSAVIALPYYTTVPSGQFQATLDEHPEQGKCQIIIIINQAPYLATQGSTTINKNGETYTIDASGSSMSVTGTTENFTVHFTGPLVTD